MSQSTPSPPAPALHPTACAICGTMDHADERWPSTLDPTAFTPEVFSARRVPDRVHYRMVTCRGCGLLRSDPVLEGDHLATLYRAASFDYGDELPSLRVTYGEALGRVEALTDRRDGLLDIGCGSGFVLEEALKRGWSDVRGVEPTTDAIAAAHPSVRQAIVEDFMRPGLFEPDSLSAITLFQVLDHIPDPLSLLRECHNVLRPGGIIMAWNHNATAWSARVLGERSPIVDVEHTYLYSPRTMRALFEKAGFDVVNVSSVRNLYSVSYLLHLFPLPRALKERLIGALRDTRLGRRQLRVPLGNLCLVARA